MLVTFSIKSENMHKAVINIMQDLLKSSVIGPIAQEFYLTLDLCLECQKT